MSGLDRTIPLEDDGTWKIKIKAHDEAGNVSAELVTEVNKDTVKPSIQNIRITDEAETSFRITVTASDDTSRIAKYEYYINGSKAGENTNGTFLASNLTPKQTHTVVVKVYDNAGLSTESTQTTATTKGELLTPNIEVSGTTRNGYYIGTVTVKIKDVSSNSRAVKARVKRTNTSPEEEYTLSNKEASFQITTDRNLQHTSPTSR